MRPSPSLMRCLCRASAPQAIRPATRERIPRPLYPALHASNPPRPHIAARRFQQSIAASIRHESTSSKPPAPQTNASTQAPESRLEKDQVPAYELTFTCKQCSTRSSHRVSKQGYHHGTVLISCPGCKNRHLISDHMKIFSDKPVTIEDLMREKGQLVKRGSLSTEGDVEFWDDGSETPRSSHFIPNSNTKGEEDAPEGRLTESPASEQASQGAAKEKP